MKRWRAATTGSVGTANGSLSTMTHESCSPRTSTPYQKLAVANSTAFGVARKRSKSQAFDAAPARHVQDAYNFICCRFRPLRRTRVGHTLREIKNGLFLIIETRRRN